MDRCLKNVFFGSILRESEMKLIAIFESKNFIFFL